LQLSSCGSTTCCDDHRPRGNTISVSSPLARACDVLLDATGAIDVAFAGGVRGSSLQRGDRLALAFISETDAAFPNAPVQLDWQSDAGTPVLKLSSTTCYDRLGHEIAGAEVALRPKQ
jgi:hypothetical protein